MLKIISIIENCPLNLDTEDNILSYLACGRIDTDGTGLSHGDKWHLKETSLKLDGKSLNADEDPFIVIPGKIVKGVKPVVLGSKVILINTKNNRSAAGVVGDIGPDNRLGEMARCLAIKLGVDPDPNTGGEDSHVIQYHIFLGVPANVNGKQYKLQPSK